MEKKIAKNKSKYDITMAYSERPFLCKIGFHEYADIYNGQSHYLGCISCYKMHWVHRKLK